MMQDNDYAKQLSSILEDPEAMAKVMSLAGSLMGSLGDTERAGEPMQRVSAENADGDEPNSIPTSVPPRDSEKNTAHGIDIGAASALAGLIGNGKKNDPRTNLLFALKPFMTNERAKKIDMLIKAMRLADIAGGFIGSGGLF